MLSNRDFAKYCKIFVFTLLKHEYSIVFEKPGPKKSENLVRFNRKFSMKMLLLLMKAAIVNQL